MSFANLPLWGVLAGIAGLAAVLFLLQLLRIRHVEVAVPTTLFWRAAAREAPVRILPGRFRHPLAYLLVLLICALLWLAFAGPLAADNRAEAYRVLFLDGSAHSSSGDDFEQAVNALNADLAGLPEGRREVIWGGARNVKLLKPGEDRLLLDRRLAALAPEAAPSALGEQLRLLSLPGNAPDNVELVIYGRAPAFAAALERLPPGMRVSRAIEYPESPPNRGIAALGVDTAASGRWDRVDVLIRVAGTDGAVSADGLVVHVDGLVLAGERLHRLADDLVAVHDLPADGRLVEARLEPVDALPVDDTARLRLPVRKVIGVALADDLNPAVRNAIEADPGLEVVSEGASVVVRRRGDQTLAGLPALEVAPAADQASAFEIGYAGDAGDADAEIALRRSVAALGLDQIDAVGLAVEAQRPIGVELRHAELRGIAVWDELLDQYNFTRSRSFPLFVSRAVRWLAAEPSWYPYLAAGRPLPADSAAGSLDPVLHPAFDALGADYMPGAAGPIPASTGRTQEVALLSDAVTEQRAGAPLAAAQAGGELSGAGLVTWLILAALLLLGAEWFLYQRGLMP